MDSAWSRDIGFDGLFEILSKIRQCKEKSVRGKANTACRWETLKTQGKPQIQALMTIGIAFYPKVFPANEKSQNGPSGKSP